MRAILRSHIPSVLLAAASVTACRQAPPPEPVARPVKTTPAQAAEPVDDLRYAASIEPFEQVILSFKVGGYVDEILRVSEPQGASHLLQQGDVVRRGTVLARLRSGDYRERVNQARAQQAEAEASLVRARSDAERAEHLFVSQSLTKPEREAAVATLAMSQARLDAAKAQLEQARITLDDSSLSAPMDAVVVSRGIETGTLAGAGTVGFVLADVNRVKAVFGVPDRVVSRLSLGQPLPVAIDTSSHAGRITAIAPSASAQSRLFSVELSIDNTSRALKPGMMASVIVPEGRERRAASTGLVVPLSAVVKSQDGGYGVFVVDATAEPPRAHLRRVGLGEITGNKIGVAEGLRSGEAVIVSGAALVIDGEPLRIIP